MKLECPNCGHCLMELNVNTSTGRDVNIARTETPHDDSIGRDGNLVTRVTETVVNGSDEVEARVAKQSGGGVLTKDQKRDILNLYNQGHSLARVRQMLGLNVSLNRIMGVVKKPHM